MFWCSRQDYYFGDDHSFNQAIFDQTRSYWKGPFIDVHQAALARQARVDTSNATNPEFALSKDALPNTYGESAAYIIVFGDKISGIVKKSWVEYFFGEFTEVPAAILVRFAAFSLTNFHGTEHERLPTELGWTKSEDEITASDQNSVAQRIIDATNGSGAEKCDVSKRSDLHTGHKARGHHR
jgi:hypothetical protein